MLYRHEINYWCSDALMGLKVVFQLLLNVHLQLPYSSIYFKNRQVTLGTFTDLHLLVACNQNPENGSSFKKPLLYRLKEHICFFDCPHFIPSAEAAVWC